jgi:outer membrane protein
MKKLPYILIAVLFVALAIMYYLHFSFINKTGLSGDDERPLKEILEGNAAIAYVNMDTLLAKFDMYFDYQGQLLDKQKKLEAQLNTNSRSYERQVVDFQDKVQKGLVTRSQAQEMEMQLMQKQQDLLQLKDQLSLELMEEEQVMNRKLQFSIYEYLEEYNKDGEFEYILGYSFGGPILFSSEKLDITKEVIKGINEKYQKTKTQK